jgi:hypothetical protein
MWNFLIGPITSLISNVLDRVLPERMSEAERAKIQAQIVSELIKADWNTIEKQAQVILAEAQGQSWLQRNWRPILMLTIVAIVANNYLIYPYLSLFTTKVIILELPEKLWNLMTIGVGGYIAGRSAEKIIKDWKGK